MAERLSDVVAQIHNVRQLDAVVTAIRGIAASRAQKSRSLLAGIEAYADVVSHAIGQALSFLPQDAMPAHPAGRAMRGVLLFCAEQGFAGGFSERVLDTAASELPGARCYIVGTRGLAVATERGLKLAWSVAMAARVESIAGFAGRLADALYRDVAVGALTELVIFFSRSLAGGGTEVDRRSLLPIDFGRFTRPIGRQPPLTNLAPELLLQQLAAEYVYTRLCQAATHAFEAENQARMLAMASAKTNIENKLATLSKRERKVRQDEITLEIMELTR
jgi:F-type H+-transporting ATPase subunit gamma